jgi:hypothetical protein
MQTNFRQATALTWSIKTSGVTIGLGIFRIFPFLASRGSDATKLFARMTGSSVWEG